MLAGYTTPPAVNAGPGLSARDLKVVIHQHALRHGIVPGSDLLRDFGFTRSEEVMQAVKSLLDMKAVSVTGALLESDPKSVFRVTISVRPANRAYSRLVFQQHGCGAPPA